VEETIPVLFIALHFQHSEPDYTDDMCANIRNGHTIIAIYPDHLSLSFSLIKHLDHASVMFSQMSYSSVIKPFIHVSAFPLVTASHFLA
jgi:hypothetical protein